MQKQKSNNTAPEKGSKGVIIAVIIGLVIVGVVMAAIIINELSKSSGKEIARTDEDIMWFDQFEDSKESTDYIKISVDGYGEMIVKLDHDTAPITVDNFKKLVSENFYANNSFHRVIKGFMIQGGMPSGTQKPASIKGEFSTNGVTNNLKHTRGVISMARTSDNKDSASSQFFIVHETSSHLDGDYAAFGKLVCGYSVLDDIASAKVLATGERLTPAETIVINTISFVKYKG